jgi:hypothetical protein
MDGSRPYGVIWKHEFARWCLIFQMKSFVR